MEQVAKQAGVSHDRLRHLFKEVTGKSLVRYLNETRLARACILLANSPMALQQVADACGYKDEYYFSAVFKRFMKIPPGAYRFRHLGSEATPRKRRGRIDKPE